MYLLSLEPSQEREYIRTLVVVIVECLLSYGLSNKWEAKGFTVDRALSPALSL